MRRRDTNLQQLAQRGKGESGFTFVEIMMALAVGAIVIVGMYQAFNTLHKWWIATGARSDMRQNARAGLETLTRDIEMAGYQTTSYEDVKNKTGLAITLALESEIEMDQQRVDHTNGTIDWANPLYQPKLVYYHLATDMKTGRQNLYRQIRTQPGLRAADEIVAENVSDITFVYLDKNNNSVDCLNQDFNGKPYGEYTVNMPRPLVDGDYCRAPVAPCTSRVPCNSGLRPDPLKNIRRITVSLTTVPAGATTITAAATAGAATIEVGNTAGFPTSGKIDIFTTSGTNVVEHNRVTYTGKDATHFSGCAGVPALAAGSVVARSMPIGGAVKPFTLTASVMPQNLGAADEATPDCTPPSVPTGLVVIDTRSCRDKLKVKWNKGADLDLAGYKIFYGPTDYVKVPVRGLTLNASSEYEFTLNPDCLLITKDADRTLAPAPPASNPYTNTYTIQILAYDSSGNDSEKSAAVSGNPLPDGALFGGPNGNDTTVNPLKPSPPQDPLTGLPRLNVSRGATEGELIVTWPAAASATVGYRLYRSTEAFTDGAHIDSSLQIASSLQIDRETKALGATQPTWIDKNLERCWTYHYAVASVNCDETFVAGYLYRGDPNAALSDYAVGSGAPLAPPPVPRLDGTRAGENRAYITLTNPLEAANASFDRTEIYWSKGAPPHLDGSSVVDGDLLPDSDSGSGSPGTFTNRGSQVVDFDSETDAAPALPSLDSGETYHFLAVSRCGGNAASATAAATILGPAECIDNPPGPPDEDFFSNGTITSCPDSVVLGWQYPGTNPVPADLAGFHVERTMIGGGAALGLTEAPTGLASWTDASPLHAGEEYTYAITATDCLGSPSSPPYDLPSVIRPGRLQRYQPLSGPSHELDAANFVTTISDTLSSYTYHNNVKFYLQNTSRSIQMIKRMRISWGNAGVVLNKITFGATSSTTERSVVVNANEVVDVEAHVLINGVVETKVVGKAWEATFDDVVTIADIAGLSGNPSGAVPVLLRFVTPAGTVNRLADLRGEALHLSLWVLSNPSPGGIMCDVPNRLVLDVPRGPELGCFSQSAPGSHGIDSYKVAGVSGTARDTDIDVSTGIGVNIYGSKVVDNSRELFSDGANRGFKPDTFGVYTISADAANLSADPVMPAGVHVNHTLETIGGDRYAICPTCPSLPVAAKLMPQEADKVHWYYALVEDKTGNWDRVPNPDTGNYAYFQTAFDVCDFKPQAPEQVSVSDVGDRALVAWCAPTEYVSVGGLVSPIRADDALAYYVEYSSNGGATWQSAPNGANLSSRSYTDSSLVAGTIYRVRAKNSCVTCTACTGTCCSDPSNPSPGVVVLP